MLSVVKCGGESTLILQRLNKVSMLSAMKAAQEEKYLKKLTSRKEIEVGIDLEEEILAA